MKLTVCGRSVVVFVLLSVGQLWIPSRAGAGGWDCRDVGNYNKLCTHDSGDQWKGSEFESIGEGRGTYSWPNGASFFGDWKAGEQNGWGTFTYSDGSTWEGTWKDGKKIKGTHRSAAKVKAEKEKAERRSQIFRECMVDKSKGRPPEVITHIRDICIKVIDNPSLMDRLRYWNFD